MPARLRKLIGLLVLLVWIFIYALLAMGIAVRVLPDGGAFVRFLYYAVAGLAWVLPVMPLIKWMSRPDAPPQPESPAP